MGHKRSYSTTGFLYGVFKIPTSLGFKAIYRLGRGGVVNDIKKATTVGAGFLLNWMFVFLFIFAGS